MLLLLLGLKGKLRTDMNTVYFYPTCHLSYDQWPQMSIIRNINLLQFLFHMSEAIIPNFLITLIILFEN